MKTQVNFQHRYGAGDYVLTLIFLTLKFLTVKFFNTIFFVFLTQYCLIFLTKYFFVFLITFFWKISPHWIFLFRAKKC